MTKNPTVGTNAARLDHLPSIPVKCRVVLPFIVMLILAVPVQAETVTDFDRFKLWNDCRPMRLVVENLYEDETDIGLTEDVITAAVRSRLRAARLYTAEELRPYLYINVNVVNAAFHDSVEYNKWVKDEASGLKRRTTTWKSSSTGTHSRDASYILSSVSQHVDMFIDEYLRVNEDACKR